MTAKSNTKDFIEKSVIIHKNFYDYSLVEYVDNKSKVKIICKIHGIFSQIPLSHLKGSGCPNCGHIKRNETKCKKNKFYKQSNTNTW